MKKDESLNTIVAVGCLSHCKGHKCAIHQILRHHLVDLTLSSGLNPFEEFPTDLTSIKKTEALPFGYRNGQKSNFTFSH